MGNRPGLGEGGGDVTSRRGIEEAGRVVILGKAWRG